MSNTYTVRRYFNGEHRGFASTHRTLAAAEKAAAAFNRAFGDNGWSARIYRGDERVD